MHGDVPQRQMVTVKEYTDVAQRVLEKSGFLVSDGTPTHFVSNGKTVDAIHYIKLLSE